MAANYETSKKTKKGWTKQPNALLRDKDLTSDAFKVITFLLSITGDYSISMKGISKTINLSESKVKRAVDLLQDTGYLKIVKIRNGKLFGGYKWLISDVPGSYRKCADDISMDGISNPTTSMYENSNDGISIYEKSIDAPIYEYTEGYEQINNERRIDEHTEEYELPLHQPDAVVADVSLPLYSGNSSWESSSEAKASPLQCKKPEQGEEVISPKEHMYQQFLEKFPKAPLNREKELTRQAFFNIPNLEQEFDRIMWGLDEWCNSPEWRKENGRYIKKPLNWIEERQWEKANAAESLSDNYFENLFSPEEA